VTPKFGTSYQLDSSICLFHRRQGLRPGGAQTIVPGSICSADLNALSLKETPGSYNSDSVWPYEVRSKNALADNRIRVDASAYFIQLSNIQRQVYLSSCGHGFISNSGQARSKGRRCDRQRGCHAASAVHARAGYDQVTIDSTMGGPGTGHVLLARKGDRIGGPPFTGTFSGQYSVPVMGMDGYGRFDYTYTSPALAGSRPTS
jgi:iron complex outermembrane receptor protein